MRSAHAAALAALLVLVPAGLVPATAADPLPQCYPTPTPTPTPAPSNPAPTPGPSVPAAAFTDRTGVSFSDNGITGQYHVYADGLDLSKPVGIVMHLHGDGGWEYRSPAYSTVKAYRAAAKAKNAVLLVPKSPLGTTWWRDARSADWAAGLLANAQSRYGITGETWLTGYSGGAQSITQHFVPKHYVLLAGGGGAVLVGGGGVYSNNLTTAGRVLNGKYEIRYAAGSADRGNDAEGFDAYAAAQRGVSAFKAAGFPATLQVKQGENHSQIADDGPRLLAENWGK